MLLGNGWTRRAKPRAFARSGRSVNTWACLNPRCLNGKIAQAISLDWQTSWICARPCRYHRDGWPSGRMTEMRSNAEDAVMHVMRHLEKVSPAYAAACLQLMDAMADFAEVQPDVSGAQPEIENAL